MAITNELISEINRLANKKKSVGLSYEEQVLQDRLRKEYLIEFRKNTKSVLNNLDVYKEMQISRFLINDNKMDFLINNQDIKAVKKSGVNYIITYDYKKTSEKMILKSIRSIS
jgi:uncharacterized protein YnzC (UPF0291/DUF896 family)